MNHHSAPSYAFASNIHWSRVFESEKYSKEHSFPFIKEDELRRWVAILEKSGNRRTESDIKLLDREILSSVHFFDDMSIELRYAVLKEASLFFAPSGTEIFAQGDLANGLYVILDGLVSVEIKVGQTQEIEDLQKAAEEKPEILNTKFKTESTAINKLGPLSWFGEKGLSAEKQNRGASVVATQDCILMFISSEDYLQAMDAVKRNTQEAIVDALRRTPFFLHWPIPVLSKAAEDASISIHSPATVLARQGDLCAAFLVVLSGECIMARELHIPRELKLNYDRVLYSDTSKSLSFPPVTPSATPTEAQEDRVHVNVGRISRFGSFGIAEVVGTNAKPLSFSLIAITMVKLLAVPRSTIVKLLHDHGKYATMTLRKGLSALPSDDIIIRFLAANYNWMLYKMYQGSGRSRNSRKGPQLRARDEDTPIAHTAEHFFDNLNRLHKWSMEAPLVEGSVDMRTYTGSREVYRPNLAVYSPVMQLLEPSYVRLLREGNLSLLTSDSGSAASSAGGGTTTATKLPPVTNAFAGPAHEEMAQLLSKLPSKHGSFQRTPGPPPPASARGRLQHASEAEKSPLSIQPPSQRLSTARQAPRLRQRAVTMQPAGRSFLRGKKQLQPFPPHTVSRQSSPITSAREAFPTQGKEATASSPSSQDEPEEEAPPPIREESAAPAGFPFPAPIATQPPKQPRRFKLKSHTLYDVPPDMIDQEIPRFIKKQEYLTRQTGLLESLAARHGLETIQQLRQFLHFIEGKAASGGKTAEALSSTSVAASLEKETGKGDWNLAQQPQAGLRKDDEALSDDEDPHTAKDAATVINRRMQRISAKVDGFSNMMEVGSMSIPDETLRPLFGQKPQGSGSKGGEGSGSGADKSQRHQSSQEAKQYYLPATVFSLAPDVITTGFRSFREEDVDEPNVSDKGRISPEPPVRTERRSSAPLIAELPSKQQPEQHSLLREERSHSLSSFSGLALPDAALAEVDTDEETQSESGSFPSVEGEEEDDVSLPPVASWTDIFAARQAALEAAQTNKVSGLVAALATTRPAGQGQPMDPGSPSPSPSKFYNTITSAPNPPVNDPANAYFAGQTPLERYLKRKFARVRTVLTSTPTSRASSASFFSDAESEPRLHSRGRALPVGQDDAGNVAGGGSGSHPSPTKAGGGSPQHPEDPRNAFKSQPFRPGRVLRSSNVTTTLAPPPSAGSSNKPQSTSRTHRRVYGGRSANAITSSLDPAKRPEPYQFSRVVGVSTRMPAPFLVKGIGRSRGETHAAFRALLRDLSAQDGDEQD